MINYDSLYFLLQETNLKDWSNRLPDQIQQGLSVKRWGDLPKWYTILEKLPTIQASYMNLNNNAIQIGHSDDCSNTTRTQLKKQLLQLQPWRKGPFEIFGLELETEWRSDFKWSRLAPYIDLRDKFVLDVGCANGYYGWRMLGAGARTVIGLDPSPRYVLQWQALRQYLGDLPSYVLPLRFEDFPMNTHAFDTVFSMGVLYHRRSPLDHLLQLKAALKPTGELILETLVVTGEKGRTLMPKNRYAKMPNVWFIPSIETLISWLEKLGYSNIEVLNTNTTTTDEQRTTAWMTYESLAQFLDPKDKRYTIEGYPAPVRGLILAKV